MRRRRRAPDAVEGLQVRHLHLRAWDEPPRFSRQRLGNSHDCNLYGNLHVVREEDGLCDLRRARHDLGGQFPGGLPLVQVRGQEDHPCHGGSPHCIELLLRCRRHCGLFRRRSGLHARRLHRLGEFQLRDDQDMREEPADVPADGQRHRPAARSLPCGHLRHVRPAPSRENQLLHFPHRPLYQHRNLYLYRLSRAQAAEAAHGGALGQKSGDDGLKNKIVSTFFQGIDPVTMIFWFMMIMMRRMKARMKDTNMYMTLLAFVTVVILAPASADTETTCFPSLEKARSVTKIMCALRTIITRLRFGREKTAMSPSELPTATREPSPASADTLVSKALTFLRDVSLSLPRAKVLRNDVPPLFIPTTNSVFFFNSSPCE
mmetsp:Transcript_933/g.2566  ORF Transcript_933/g.2566 Transcript_933/m.2566 type:complete len:375 (+) Transcript_933:452-1576(+)